MEVVDDEVAVGVVVSEDSVVVGVDELINYVDAFVNGEGRQRRRTGGMRKREREREREGDYE